MQTGDGAPDLREIAERYGGMNDDALMDEARAYDSLIDEVKTLLRAEFARRGLEPPVIEEKPEVNGPLETIGTYNNLGEASVARAMLEAAGIPAFLCDENVTNIYGGAMFACGTRLQVAEKDVIAAREVLRQPADVIPVEEDTDWMSYEPVRCPHCHLTHLSFQIEDAGGVSWKWYLLIGFPVCNPPRYRWRCRDCKTEWVDDGLPREITSRPVG